jgi:nucleoside-diphosphate-sugar epimerase
LILVTGITGHTGKWFLQKLISEKYQGKIRCLVRENSNTKVIDYSQLNIEKVHGSLEDAAFVSSAMKGIKTVIHISSIKFSNIVINAAIKNSVEWTILVHTTGRYSKYKSASEEYKNIEDGILQKRNQIGVTILRPTMIYGSSKDMNMYKLIDYLYRHKFFPLFGKGDNLMQPVHAKDLGYAYYDVLMNKEITFNKEYNLSGKNPVTYIDLIKTVSSNIRKNNIIIKIPLRISIIATKIYNLFVKKAKVSVEQVLRMQEDKDFKHDEATKDFGYLPISFYEGIKDEVNEYLSSKNKGRY